MSESIIPIKTVGRRKGSKDIVPRKKRTDSSIQDVIPDDTKQKIICHDIMVRKLGKISDPNNLDEIDNRIDQYLSLCIDNAVSPTVSGLALALGINRRTLWTWISEKNGTIKNPEVMDTLKGVYSQIETQYEELLTEGKIVPVSAIFLMKNNHGYKDQTDHIVTARTEQQETEETLLDRAGLLTD